MPAAGGIAAEYGDRAAGLCGAQGGPPARRRASRASGSPRRPARRTRVPAPWGSGWLPCRYPL